MVDLMKFSSINNFFTHS